MKVNLRKFRKDRRGFGHFIALGMGVAAALVLFGYVWPAAKTMMGSTVTSMTSLNSQMESGLNGMTVTASGSTVTAALPSGVTPTTTTADYSVTVNGTTDSVTNVSVSGSTATLTVGTSISSGATVNVTYSNGSTVYSGTAN